MNLFKNPKRKEPGDVLMDFGDGDFLSEHDVYNHIMCMGMSGSSKTSSVGATLAMALLRRNWPLIVLACKDDEVPTWIRRAKAAGREADILHLRIGGKESIDLLNSELAQGSPLSVCDMLKVLLEVVQQQEQKSSETFWINAAIQLAQAGITITQMATGSCSIADLYSFVSSVPRSQESLKDEVFYARSFAIQMTRHAEDEWKNSRDYWIARNLVLNDFPSMPDKMNGSIIQELLTFIAPFQTGAIHDLISSKSTFTIQEVRQNRRILLVDVPVVIHGIVGVVINTAIKLLAQNVAMRMGTSPDLPPLCIWADEGNRFLCDRDTQFMAISRQYRVAMITLSQSLSMMYDALGSGDAARQKVDGYLSNCGTIFGMSNIHEYTNSYLSKMAGESRHIFFSGSAGKQGWDPVGDFFQRNEYKPNLSFSQQMRPDLPPEVFPTLRKGGKVNDFVAEAIVLQAGKKFSNGKIFKKIQVKQIFT